MSFANISVDTFLALGGIILSVFLFLLGYRKTIGAAQTRTENANNALLHALVKHFALTQDIVRLDEIEHLRIGKALTDSVKISGIHAPSVIESMLIWKIFENEYLTTDEKRSSLKRVSRSFSGEGAGPIKRPPQSFRETISEFFLNNKDESSSLLNIFLLALSSTVASILIILLYQSVFLEDTSSVPDFDTGLIIALITSIGAATAGVAAYSELKRRTGRISFEPIQMPARSEIFRRVNRVVEEFPNIDVFDDHIDSIITRNDGSRVGVETLETGVYNFYGEVSDKIEQFEKAKNIHELDFVVLVASEDIVSKFDITEIPDWLKAMTTREFEDWMVG